MEGIQRRLSQVLRAFAVANPAHKLAKSFRLDRAPRDPMMGRMYTLIIANKNYSSWSLRPWILMKEQGIAFEERQIPFRTPGFPPLTAVSPTGRVPLLRDGELGIWDSLAIVEYLAERHPSVWAQDVKARAWSRSAAAEIHSGFNALRDLCSMSVGQRIKLHEYPERLRKDVDRIAALWTEGLNQFGGPFLAGAKFTAADAFYCPVAFRVQSYGLQLPGPAMGYAKRLLALKGMREWYEAGLKETWRDPPHDEEMRLAGTCTADLRATEAVTTP
jgi:glutathione S-transferase